MVEYIKNHLKKIQLKFMFVSLGLSFALWFVCLNFADPVTYENFTLRLRLDNEQVLTDNMKTIENRRELENVSVNVHVTGIKSELDYLAENRTIYAHIDLNSSELVNVPNTKIGQLIPVRIGVGFDGEGRRGSYNITSVSPDIVGVVMDRIQIKPINLAVTTTGETPQGYKAMKPVIDPSVVEFTGPSSIISKIPNPLTFEVDLTEARSDIKVENREIEVFDQFGAELSGFEMDESVVNFTVPIFRSVPVTLEVAEPLYTGSPAENVLVTGAEVSPEIINVLVHGDQAKLEAISLDPADLEGINETVDVAYDLNEYLLGLSSELGTELYLENPDENQVTVTYTTERVIMREFELSVDRDIHFSGEASLTDRRRQPLTEYLTVTLKGAESLLNNLTIEDIIGRVDLASLADQPDGEYNLEVVFTLPEGVELADEGPVLGILMSSFEGD